MLSICLKYFYIILCSFYLYKKLLNIPSNKIKIIIQIISSIFLSIFIHFLRIYFAPISILLLATLLTAISYFLEKQPLKTTIVTSTFALCCSYVLFMISTLFCFPLHMILSHIINNKPVLYTTNILIIGALQILIATLLFKMNRFKTGMPFLKQQTTSDIGSYITISLLISTTFLNTNMDKTPYFLAPVFFIILSGILIFFWWKSKLTENYWKQAKEREINELKSEIAELKEYNATLSKIIHKDNKLIPAMLLSVNDTISETCESADEAQRRRLTGILSQLNDVAKERKGLVLFSESEAKANYATGVPKIDSQLKYQAAVAYSSQSCFDVMISDKLNVIVPEIISAEDLRTLVADLLTNALIAVKSETKRNVLFHTHIENNTFCIDFYDSGAPFDAEVLEKIGKERITTHLDDGGSGIGYMTTFEILNRCNGTWTVDENLNLELYTKKVRICFPLEANH